jgi:hypothetical protein
MQANPHSISERRHGRDKFRLVQWLSESINFQFNDGNIWAFFFSIPSIFRLREFRKHKICELKWVRDIWEDFNARSKKLYEFCWAIVNFWSQMPFLNPALNVQYQKYSSTFPSGFWSIASFCTFTRLSQTVLTVADRGFLPFPIPCKCLLANILLIPSLFPFYSQTSSISRLLNTSRSVRTLLMLRAWPRLRQVFAANSRRTSLRDGFHGHRHLLQIRSSHSVSLFQCF